MHTIPFVFFITFKIFTLTFETIITSNIKISMGKDKRIEPEELPEVMIQHIQSFLKGKQAAQTTILSKSWYTAWSTRPNLDFDQRDFGIDFRNQDDQGFWEFVAKTIQRYEALKLKIESFRLWIHILKDSNSLYVKDFIVRAMKMGAVDFNFEMCIFSRTFTLPYEVLGSKSLIRLCVDGCKIDLRPDKNVSCWKLESLILKRVHAEGNIVRDLISNCPLIEKLTLGSCTCQRSDSVGTYEGLGSVVDGPSNLYNLCKLKSLFLSGVNVDKLFFSNMSCNFPCLKDLSLDNCGGYNYKGIQLCSRSLEFVSFKQKRLLRADFDVPSIRKLAFSGSSWPSLLFKTVSREWESDISVSCYCPSTRWFLKVNKLLTRLSSSKVSLSLSIESIVEKKVDFRGLSKTAMENLTIYAPCSALFVALECLFWSCRPKFVTLYVNMKMRLNNEFLEILGERDVERIREKCLTMSNEVEEAINVEVFEESFAERQPLPPKISFQLRWRAVE